MSGVEQVQLGRDLVAHVQAGLGEQRVEEDQPPHRSPRSHERGDHAGERVAEEDQVIDPGEGIEYRVGEAGGPSHWILER
jgi:hypothetical protein